MDIYNEDLLNRFEEKNPLRFSEQRMALVRRDFYNHKRGLFLTSLLTLFYGLKSCQRDMSILERSCCRLSEITHGNRFLKSDAAKRHYCRNIFITRLKPT